MAHFEWDAKKNTRLVRERSIGFERIIQAVSEGGLLDVLEHPNKEIYPNQRIMVVEVDGYAYAVPFVENGGVYFLKTVIPSRKLTREYLE